MNRVLGVRAKKLAALLVLMVSTGAFANAGEAPGLAELVKQNKLPPLEDRLPKNPYVVDYKKENKSIGQYGGQLRLLMGRAKDLGQITVYTYARLIGFTPSLDMKPDLLESVDVKDGREFTFKIREGHRWSDGELFTSEDFRYYWEDMIGNEQLGRAGPSSFMRVEGEPPKFEVLDELTVRYTWAKPNPAFLPALAGPSPLYIYRPAHYMKQFHAKYGDEEKLNKIARDAGSKDWSGIHTRKQRQRRPENPALPTLQSWMNTTAPPSQRFVFTRNPFFHRVDTDGNQLPYIDELIMSVASKDVIPAKTGAGETDLQARYLRFDNFTFLKEAEDKNGFNTYLWSTGKGSQVALYPNMNTNDPVWRGLMRDVRFRRALSLGIDRDEINETIYFGLANPSANTVLPQSPLYKSEFANAWATHDVEMANTLLDDAGLGARDDDGVRLLPNGERAEITIESAGESTEESDVLELIADHWKAIGIKVFIRSSQRDIFRRRANAGETLISVFFGLNAGLASSQLSPEELAPTAQPQLQWPKWGQYFETNHKAGEPVDVDEAAKQVERYNSWLLAESDEERTKIWQDMLHTYTDQVFSIGTVNNSRQPVVVSKKLMNVPEEGIYSWEPTAYFGVYRPDTFWFKK